jgi:hypothetical protein
MADDQGYANRGPDERILGSVGGRLQQKLSFHSDEPPKAAVLGSRTGAHISLSWPPFLSIAVKDPKNADKYLTFRAGWRWDKNWRPHGQDSGGGYIADVIIKRMDHVVSPDD